MNADALARKLVHPYAELPREQLPSMYDLPSEFPEEPGLPDQFHFYQPELLNATFLPPGYDQDQVFCAADLNLYYDPEHTLWHKRPDWFGVVGLDRFYGEEKELRLSYVMWQERVIPFLVLEILSEGTSKEDFGKTTAEEDGPPTKWEVYERILKIPYYVIYDRHQVQVYVHGHDGHRYRPLNFDDGRIWLPEIQLGLGLWQGRFHNFDHFWLRFYDEEQLWIPNPEEIAERESAHARREKARADREQQRADQMAAKLRALGINPDD
jgi:Uma2 family endonuclease